MWVVSRRNDASSRNGCGKVAVRGWGSRRAGRSLRKEDAFSSSSMVVEGSSAAAAVAHRQTGSSRVARVEGTGYGRSETDGHRCSSRSGELNSAVAGGTAS